MQRSPYIPFRIEQTGIIAIFVVFCVPVVVSENEETMPEGIAMIIGGGFEMGSSSTPSELPTRAGHLEGSVCQDRHEAAKCRIQGICPYEPGVARRSALMRDSMKEPNKIGREITTESDYLCTAS